MNKNETKRYHSDGGTDLHANELKKELKCHGAESGSRVIGTAASAARALVLSPAPGAYYFSRLFDRSHLTLFLVFPDCLCIPNQRRSSGRPPRAFAGALQASASEPYGPPGRTASAGRVGAESAPQSATACRRCHRPYVDVLNRMLMYCIVL